jgi:deoxyhypusine synthase
MCYNELNTDDSIEKGELLNKKISHVDVSNKNNLHDLLVSFQTTSFQSRNLAKCLQVYKRMLSDEKSVILLGLAGALVPGGMRKTLTDMIRHRLVDVVVSTGANLYHDFLEASGGHHYIGSRQQDDSKLCKLDIDRIYDTLLDDTLASKTDTYFAGFAETLENRAYSTREFMMKVGESIHDKQSFIRACTEERVPLFCPTLHDSGIGIGLSLYYSRHRNEKRFMIDFCKDNYEIMQICQKAEVTGVVILGGGVPKNYIQQIEPMLQVNGYNQENGHKYAIQITMDDPKWGGLSGCTFSEAKSWGKIEKEAETAAVYLDCTIGLPLLVGALLSENNIVLNRKHWQFEWDDDTLVKLY